MTFSVGNNKREAETTNAPLAVLSSGGLCLQRGSIFPPAFCVPRGSELTFDQMYGAADESNGWNGDNSVA